MSLLVEQWLKKQVTNINSVLAGRTYRNVPHTSTGRTPAEIVFGRIPRTHLSMVVPSMVDRMRDSLERPDSSAPRVFAQGDRVWVRDYRPNVEKWQPGVVQSCMGSLSYNVELEGGRQRKVHVDHLIRQAPGCAPVSSEPVVTGEKPLNTSEPSDCDTVTPLDQPLTPQECGTVGPPE